MRPVYDTVEPVLVGFRFTPTLAVLNERKQELQIRGMLVTSWTDNRLQWNPEEYGGINETTIPVMENGAATIWTPEVVLNESLDTDFRTIYSETNAVTVSYDGKVHWHTLAITKSYCGIENTHFPFDKQTCYLTFTTWLYQTNEQIFYAIDDLLKNEIYKKYTFKHSVWIVNIGDVLVGNNSYECEACTGEEQSYVRYTVSLKRSSPGQNFFIYVFPCIVIAVMIGFAAWLPNKTDVDAPSFSLTCVLTLFVYLTFVNSDLALTGTPRIVWCIIFLIFGALMSTLCFGKTGHTRLIEDNTLTTDKKTTINITEATINVPENSSSSRIQPEVPPIQNNISQEQNGENNDSTSPNADNTDGEEHTENHSLSEGENACYRSVREHICSLCCNRYKAIWVVYIAVVWLAYGIFEAFSW